MKWIYTGRTRIFRTVEAGVQPSCSPAPSRQMCIGCLGPAPHAQKSLRQRGLAARRCTATTSLDT
ncbi:hypothetical protein B0H10DRAFT_2072494 [Mycena sp. CBHHK59/15]|nr:hypothetical protein B0H10DRAFT_2072494 [Mycena sp. CBHHK59/15]